MRRFCILISLAWLYTCGGGDSTGPSIPKPTVTSFNLELDEDTQKAFTFVGTDANNDPLTFSITSQPTNGSISVQGAGGIYTPNDNYNGVDLFSYSASSVNGQSNIASVAITINAVDDKPYTIDVSASTDEDNDVTISLQAEEFDGDNFEFNIISNPSNGSVNISGSSATYYPNQDWNGTDTFEFEAVDSSSKSVKNSATATIVVNAVNDAPVANNMTVSTDENRIVQLDISLDASDVDGDNLNYTLTSGVNDGEISLNGNVATYTPNQDWNGEDTFKFKVNDGIEDSNEATVTITVNAINDPPISENVSASTMEDITVDIPLSASDIDSDNLTYEIVSEQSGSVIINGNIASYTPNQDWNGEDFFTYKANDGIVDSNISTVTISVNPVNDPPIAGDTNLSTNEDNTLFFSLTDFISYDIDASQENESEFIEFSSIEYSNLRGSIFLRGDLQGDGSIITYQITVNEEMFRKSDLSNWEIYFIPEENYFGESVFLFKTLSLDEDTGISTKSDYGRFAINVSPVNDAPTVSNIETSTNEDNTIEISLEGSDVEGDDLTYSIVSGSSNGSISINESSLTFIPNTNYNGTDTFTYKAYDGEFFSNVSTITLEVISVNDAPTPSNIGPENTFTYVNSTEGTTIDLVGSDVDGDDLTFQIDSNPNNGTVTIDGNQATYVPTANKSGRDSFTYIVNDGQLSSSSSGLVTVDTRSFGENVLSFGDFDNNSYVAIDLNQPNSDNNGCPGGPFWWKDSCNETAGNGHDYSGANLGFSLWIKPNFIKIDDYGTLISRRSEDGSKYFSLNLTDDGNILFKSVRASSSLPISVEFPAGIDTTNSVDNTHWTHIFFSITHGSTSNYVELYVDSKLISGAHVDREVTTTIGRLKQDVLIGIERIDRDTNNGQFAGKIDEVLIFQGVSHNVIALTASEVDELYNDRNQIFNPIGYFSRDNSVIWQHTNDYEIGYWKFNEGSGDTTNDDSAYNSPTTIHGALWQTNK